MFLILSCCFIIGFAKRYEIKNSGKLVIHNQIDNGLLAIVVYHIVVYRMVIFIGFHFLALCIQYKEKGCVDSLRRIYYSLYKKLCGADHFDSATNYAEMGEV